MTKTGVITSFTGEHQFLSNFYQSGTFKWRNEEFFTAEQAFQYAKTWYPRVGEAQKCKDLGMRLLDTGAGATARRYGREVPIDVDEWDARRVTLMREIVHAKFHGVPRIAGQLINTGAMLLVEGNTWGDTFWGRCDGKGLNTLGTILMECRGYWLYHQACCTDKSVV